MSQLYAFRQMGPGFNVTVAGTTPTTNTLFLSNAITTGNMPASGVRLANVGGAAVFLQFGVNATTISANITTGMAMLALSVETFDCMGQNYLSMCSSGTVTVNVTPGRGL